MNNGFDHWLIQRISAVYIGFFIISCLIFFSLSDDLTYFKWRGYFDQPVVIILSALFCISLLYHAWIGLKDIMIDYIHSPLIRMLVLSIISFLLLAAGFWLFGLLLQGFSR